MTYRRKAPMRMQQRHVNISLRTHLPRRSTVLVAAVCAAVVALVPASSIHAAETTGADLVLVDLSFDRAAVGTPHTYAYEIDNRGSDSATRVVFTAMLQGISSFESASSPQGACTHTHGTGTVTCNIGELASGGSATVEIVATPSDQTSSEATVTSGAGQDPDRSNNSASSSPQVQAAGSADLWVYPNSGIDDTGVGSTGYAVPGEPYDYSIDVINNGPAVATDVMLSVLLPFGVEFQSAEVPCSVFADENSSTVVTCSLGDIETARTVKLTAMAPLGAAGQTLRTEVFVDGSGPDPGPQPNDVSNYLVIAPGLSAEDLSGSEGIATIEIPVVLYGSVDHPVTVDWATSDGAALAGKDYEATTGTLTFAPGQTTRSVSVPVLADRKTEANETLTLTLSNVGAGASGPPVTLVKPQAIATILDNDPKVSLRNVRVRERNKGMTSANFTIKLSHASPDVVTFRFATVNGSARARSDYKRVKKTIAFLPGQTKQTVSVSVKGDRRNEGKERFFAKLSKVKGAVPGDVKGVAKIVDND
jgi:uncharacterized repeat protein (TIGR01451 family)